MAFAINLLDFLDPWVRDNSDDFRFPSTKLPGYDLRSLVIGKIKLGTQTKQPTSVRNEDSAVVILFNIRCKIGNIEV